MRFLLPLYSLICWLSLSEAGAQTGRGRAVLVGVDRYDSGDIRPLKHCGNDAKALRDTLIPNCGHDPQWCRLLTSDSGEPPTQRNILKSLQQVCGAADSADTVLFAFSGHGMPDAGGTNNNYLLPKDVDLALLSVTGISYDQVARVMDESEAGRAVFVLDACHSGGVSATGRGVEVVPSEDFLRLDFQAEGRVTLASCKAAEASFEWDAKGQGAFSYFVAVGLAGAADGLGGGARDGNIDLQELGAFVQRSVADWAYEHRDITGGRPQTPVTHAENIVGQFVVASLRPKPGATRLNPVDGAELVWIPGREFMMGTDESDIGKTIKRYGWENTEWRKMMVREAPKRRVAVGGFWMYTHEVTAGQYRRFCEATGREAPPDPQWGKQADDHPVVNVTWDDAQAYCKWAGTRLPKEAEWEFAACGGENKVFPWGDEWDRKKANSASYHVGQDLLDNSLLEALFVGKAPWVENAMTTPVGTFDPNAVGLFDMAGNVWEWCDDWFVRYPGSQVGDEAFGQNCRILRGGCWGSCPQDLRCACRGALDPTGRYHNCGFRCVMSL